MPSALTYDLHALTARLDRAADRLLRAQAGVSYSRFLALFAVGSGAATQRELAAWLGLTEPSVSRLAHLLVDDGLLDVAKTPGTGNRHRLELTGAGEELVARCGKLLEGSFAELVERSAVSLDRYHRDTRRLLEKLDDRSDPGGRS